jgi:hypothetical protein
MTSAARSVFTSSCLITPSDNSYSSASGLKFFLNGGSLPTAYSCNWLSRWWPFHTKLLEFFSQSDFQLTKLLTLVSLINSRHGQRRKHSSSSVAPIISMGTRLSAKASPSKDRVYLLIKSLLPNSECCFVACFEVATQQQLYTLQYLVGKPQG